MLFLHHIGMLWEASADQSPDRVCTFNGGLLWRYFLSVESERSTVRLPASGRPQLLISGPSAGLPRLKHLRRFTCRQGTNVQTAKLTKNQFIPLWNTLKVYAQLLLVVFIILIFCFCCIFLYKAGLLKQFALPVKKRYDFYGITVAERAAQRRRCAVRYYCDHKDTSCERYLSGCRVGAAVSVCRWPAVTSRRTPGSGAPSCRCSGTRVDDADADWWALWWRGCCYTESSFPTLGRLSGEKQKLVLSLIYSHNISWQAVALL